MRTGMRHEATGDKNKNEDRDRIRGRARDSGLILVFASFKAPRARRFKVPGRNRRGLPRFGDPKGNDKRQPEAPDIGASG